MDLFAPRVARKYLLRLREIAAHPELEPLLHLAADYEKVRKAYLAAYPLEQTVYEKGRRIFLDVRCWETPDCLGWYANIGLPDPHRTTYRLEATFNGKSKLVRGIRQAELYVPVFHQTINADSYFVHGWGQYHALDPTDVLLNPLLALDYPLLFDPNQLSKDIKRLRLMIVPAAGDEPPPRRDTPLFEVAAL